MAKVRTKAKKTAPAKPGAKSRGAKKIRRAPSLPSPLPSLPFVQSASTGGPPPERPGFLIVGIGASAGGLEAMEEVRGQEQTVKDEAKIE